MKRTQITLILLLIFLGALSVYEYIKVSGARDRTQALFAPYRSAEFSGLKWGELTAWQQLALLKVEDPNFFNHKGIDFETKGAGITSITQAIVKRLYFDSFKPGFSKIEQTLIARFVVDPMIDKKTQLTAFLNIAYFGHVNKREVVGFTEAAHIYFGKSLKQLTEQEYLQVVGMLMAPNELKPYSDNPKSRERTRRLEIYLAGKCEAQSLADNEFEGCK